jgi:hypothetical protein
LPNLKVRKIRRKKRRKAKLSKLRERLAEATSRSERERLIVKILRISPNAPVPDL